jgi:ATP-dependent Clp protease ATP-binding subunit ClpA
MFERFTDRARRVVVLSQEEARRLHHNYIGTEHVLLGLLGDQEGVAGRVLASFGLSADGVRHEVVAMIGEGQQEVSDRIPFTPRAKKTLELSLREALQLHHDYIGTEHILLGLIREGDGVAAQIMRQYSDLPAIRAAVIDQVPAWTASEGERRRALAWLARRREAPSSTPGGSAEELQAAPTPAADAALAEAARLAGPQPVGSHHLLLAALADPASAAAKALASAGVDLDQAKEALRGVDITGTSDEQPEQAGRRQMNIQVTGELVTIVATDPVIIEAGHAAIAARAAHGEGGMTAAPGGVIRGADLSGAAASSLGAAWQALRDSLAEITRASTTAQPDTSAAAQATAETGPPSTPEDKPDKPETGAA